MKKRLLAMLMVLMLVVSLLPVGALAADDTVVGTYVTVNVETGDYTNNLTVKVYGPNGNLLETITSNKARTSDCKISITLKSGEYLIEDVEKTGNGSMVETASTAISSDRKSYNNTWNTTGYGGKSFTLNVYLRANPTETPEIVGGVYTGGATVGFRAYIPQMLKLLYCEDPSLVNDSTEITGVEMFFRVGFGYGQSEPFAYINREEDYFNTELSNETGLAVPSNVSEIRISYRNGDTTGVASIEAGALSFVYHSGAGHYYSIESSNHDINVVYFYNETDGNAGNNYFQYAVRFVEDGESLGEDMPDDPEYGTGNLYRFVNWEQGSYDGTGAPFFSTTEVNEDLTVFARKVSSSEHGGTEIHVLNENDSLLNRVVELYNAAYTDAPIDIDDIDRESVKINAYDANGNTTNEDYYSNGWREYQSVEYYWVCNYDAPTGFETVQNTHIGYDNIIGVNVYFTVNGVEEKNVSIPVGEYPGDVAKRHGSTDNIIELLINSAPEKPDDDDLDVDPDDPDDTGLLTNAVTVTCTNTDVKHDAKTFDLLPGSFSIGDVVYTTEGYTCTVTVNAGAYVTAYSNSTENGTHALAEDESSTKTIKLVYHGNSWTVPEGAIPVNFNVTCDAEGPEEPTVPKKPGEADLGKLSVKLDCVNTDVEHKDGVFKLESSNCTVDDVVANTEGVYTCVVTPNYDSILNTYNENVGVAHNYTDDTAPVFTLTWDADTKAWVADADNTSITRSVQCESAELPDDYVAEYHVMNLYDELDIIAAKWDKAFTGFYLTERLDESLGKPNKGPVDGNGWDNERTYYTVKNGAYGSDEYMAYTDVYGLNYYYIQDNGTALTTATYLFTDILVTAPDENHVSEIYVLFDIRLYDDYNSGYWQDTDQDGDPDWVVYKAQSFGSGNGRWKAGSDIILEDLDGSRPYYEPTHADVNGRDVVFLGWDVENHETIYEPGDRPTNLITDAFSITEDVLSNCNITPLEVCLYGVYGYAEPDVTDYTVTIAPANIIAYTGGTAYGAIVDGSGNEFEQTTSGLPEPGYHLELSQDIQDWLEEQTGQPVGNDLSTYLTFYYEDNGTIIRQWSLDLLGVYSTDATGTATQYVYGMNTDIGEYDVRLQYWNGTEYVFEDDIDMSAASVNETYTMSIYGGGLDQSRIKAVLTVGDESIEATTVTDTGELTVLSTTNEEYTTDLNEDSSSRITADVNDGTTFTVNDSEVTLEPEDVKLLVDSVSNNDDFNAALEDDARDHVSMYNAGTESFYLDLVHADNGNVQVGLDGSLTISWPMPDDADPDGEFTIVHYVDMDRSAVMGEDNLANADKEEISVIPIGDQLIFNVESFSPFVLVYETDDGYEPIIPTPDPDDDTEYVPKWLNTEDHFAYIVGYEDGEVKPNNNITRAEVATIFFRLLTDDARARYWSQTNDYTDVAADSWYNNAISTLSNMGIINGYEDGTFQPNASITRAEFTAIATRFFDYTAEYDGAFNDVSRSAWYADCVQAAVDMGLVDGYPDGGFHPNSNITRAEAVTIVNRVLNRAPHEDHLLDEDEMNVWPDNVYGAWYYADMQEATNSHDYDWIRVSGERVEEWTEKLPERDWAALEQEWSSAYSG